MKNQESDFLCICADDDTAHRLIININEDKMVYCNIYLKPDTFLRRVERGIKHIFRPTSTFGHFDEFIFHPEDADKLQKVVDHLKGNKDKVVKKSRKKVNI